MLRNITPCIIRYITRCIIRYIIPCIITRCTILYITPGIIKNQTGRLINRRFFILIFQERHQDLRGQPVSIGIPMAVAGKIKYELVWMV